MTQDELIKHIEQRIKEEEEAYEFYENKALTADESVRSTFSMFKMQTAAALGAWNEAWTLVRGMTCE